MATTSILLFNRDLRVHDHPALKAAVEHSERVAPLFVFDEAILKGDFARPNRVAFLIDSLKDLRRALRQRGGELFVRRGDVVEQMLSVARDCHAEALFASEDYSAYAWARQSRLQRACKERAMSFHLFPGAALVQPRAVEPEDGDHFKVFTPYWRKWRAQPHRSPLRAPRNMKVPAGLARKRLPAAEKIASGQVSPDLMSGGETEARRRLSNWLRSGLEDYGDQHDDLAAEATSRLSPHLHFGSLSPAEIAARAGSKVGAEPFFRQLCWRDFYMQVLAATPNLPRTDYRPRGDRWRRDPGSLEAWKHGHTGVPIVDAGMRQLAREGFMHNRARLITASFLVKDLYIDWRLGAAHFWDLLVDGDIANNAGNWQWVAGTGNDTRPNRIFHPIRQARRFDPRGDYVRRYVEELAGIEWPQVHEPWKLGNRALKKLGYPAPIVDHDAATARFRKARGRTA